MKNSLKNFSQNHKVLSVVLSVLASVFIVAGLVAATSIGDNISVTGTLSVTGTSSIAGLSGSYITSTGNLNVAGNSRVGTVDSGTWQGTAVTVTYGGTGAATLTSGSLLVGNGTDAVTATSTLTASKGGTGVATFTENGILYGNGTGNVLVTAQGVANSVLTANAGAPVFSATPTIASTSVLGSFNTGTLTATSGTSYINALSLGTALTVANGGSGAATLSSGDLLVGNGTGAIQSTSTLAVNKGGTGQSTYTAGDILYSNVTNNLTKRNIGTAGQVLMVSDGLPVWAATSSINGSVNSGTTNRFAYYTAGTAVSSANGFIVDADAASTTFTVLNVGRLNATSSTASYLSSLNLGTALTVANGGTGAATLTDIVLGNGTSAFTATSTLTVSKGGTGVATFTENGILYGNGTGNVLVTAQGVANSVLTANAGAPVFSATPTIASTSVLGSFNTGTLTATSGTSYINALSLGTDLSVANGGTGASSFTASAVLVGNGTNAVTVNATSTAGAGTASSTPRQEFVVLGDAFHSGNGTTTVFVDSTTATNGACLQMKAANGDTVRVYITVDGTTPSLKVETGGCQ